jgi:hypothetical protein
VSVLAAIFTDRIPCIAVDVATSVAMLATRVAMRPLGTLLDVEAAEPSVNGRRDLYGLCYNK